MHAKARRPGNSALLVVPGTAFWVLVIAGAVTGSGLLVGAGFVVFAVTGVVVATIRLRAAAAARAERGRVWSEGTAGTATVVRIGTSGATINDNPEVDLELDVSVPGRPAYRAELTAYIGKLAVPRIQPGCEVAVRVDPADPSIVVLDPELRYGLR